MSVDGGVYEPVAHGKTYWFNDWKPLAFLFSTETAVDTISVRLTIAGDDTEVDDFSIGVPPSPSPVALVAAGLDKTFHTPYDSYAYLDFYVSFDDVVSITSAPDGMLCGIAETCAVRSALPPLLTSCQFVCARV